MTPTDIGVALALILGLANGAALLFIGIEVGRLSLRLDPQRADLPLVPDEGLNRGESLPELHMNRFPDGTPFDIPVSPTLMLFVSASCSPCRDLWGDIIRFARAPQRTLGVIAVIADDPLAFVENDGVLPDNFWTVFDTTGEISRLMQVQRTPFAYVVASNRVRAKGVVNRYDQLVTLVEGHWLPAPAAWEIRGTP